MIFGPWYKSLDCPNFDYCFKCKHSSDDTHPGHKFMKDPTPAQLRDLWDEDSSGVYTRDGTSSDCSESPDDD